MLFFYVVQDYDNPEAPSPLGSCVSVKGSAIDPSCPKFKQGESYYACPRQGCIDYTVRLEDDNYTADESKCNINGIPSEAPDPAQVNLLATMSLTDPIAKPKDLVDGNVTKSPQGFWHREAAAGTEPTCEETQIWQRK